MDEKKASRKIAALKAIVQTLLLERYWQQDEEEGKRDFLRAVDSDDPVSMAIVAELTEDELDAAFRWPEHARIKAGNGWLTTPVVAFLTEEQYERARITSLAADERDRIAVHALKESRADGDDAMETQERVRLAEERFVVAMVPDLVGRRGEQFDVDEKRTVDERVDAMPEPWKSRDPEGALGAARSAAEVGGPGRRGPANR